MLLKNLLIVTALLLLSMAVYASTLLYGDVQTLFPTVNNGSITVHIYTFVIVSYNLDPYEITDPTGSLFQKHLARLHMVTVLLVK